MTPIMKNKIFYWLLSAVLILLSFLYLSYLTANNPLDSEENNIEIKFTNLLPTTLINKKPDLLSLHKDYPDVTPYLLEFCYGIPLTSDSSYLQELKKFIAQDYVLKTERELKKRFTDLNHHKTRIKGAFGRLKFHFKDFKTPEEVIFSNTNYNYNATCYNESVLVGLERYIGGNHPVIIEALNPSDFPEWIRNGMEEEFMDRDVVSAWISTLLIKETTGFHIEEMIRWGKIHIITEMGLRIDNKDIAPEEILRWSNIQYKWALSNESKFWKYLMDENLLFDSNEKNRAYLINNGPYTIGLPKESPDRMGQFLGYQMVRNYILTENIELSELPSIGYKKILQSYTP